MSFFVNSVINGLGVGALYALIAVGFVLIYKATKVLNFAQASMVMVGGYLGVLFLVQLNLPVTLAILLALGISALLGFAINRFFMQPMIGQPLLATVMITIALAWILESLVVAIWGYGALAYPPFLPTGLISIGEIKVSQEMTFSFLAAMILLLALNRFFRSKQGLRMRASAEDHQVARSAGIKVKQIFSLTWVLAGLLCGVAGILLAHKLGITRSLSYVGLKALPAVLIGGLESFGGAVVAALAIGVIESVTAGYLDHIVRGGTADIVTFILMLIVITIKPYGCLVCQG